MLPNRPLESVHKGCSAHEEETDLIMLDLDKAFVNTIITCPKSSIIISTHDVKISPVWSSVSGEGVKVENISVIDVGV